MECVVNENHKCYNCFYENKNKYPLTYEKYHKLLGIGEKHGFDELLDGDVSDNYYELKMCYNGDDMEYKDFTEFDCDEKKYKEFCYEQVDILFSHLEKFEEELKKNNVNGLKIYVDDGNNFWEYSCIWIKIKLE